VRVRGVFPHAGSMQFISSELVEAAAGSDRDVPWIRDEPVIMGVDVARFGDDASVIRFRQGRNARGIPAIKLRGVDTMELAARIADECNLHRIDAIFIVSIRREPRTRRIGFFYRITFTGMPGVPAAPPDAHLRSVSQCMP